MFSPACVLFRLRCLEVRVPDYITAVSPFTPPRPPSGLSYFLFAESQRSEDPMNCGTGLPISMLSFSPSFQFHRPLSRGCSPPGDPVSPPLEIYRSGSPSSLRGLPFMFLPDSKAKGDLSPILDLQNLNKYIKKIRFCSLASIIILSIPIMAIGMLALT